MCEAWDVIRHRRDRTITKERTLQEDDMKKTRAMTYLLPQLLICNGQLVGREELVVTVHALSRHEQGEAEAASQTQAADDLDSPPLYLIDQEPQWEEEDEPQQARPQQARAGRRTELLPGQVPMIANGRVVGIYDPPGGSHARTQHSQGGSQATPRPQRHAPQPMQGNGRWTMVHNCANGQRMPGGVLMPINCRVTEQGLIPSVREGQRGVPRGNPQGAGPNQPRRTPARSSARTTGTTRGGNHAPTGRPTTRATR